MMTKVSLLRRLFVSLLVVLFLSFVYWCASRSVNKITIVFLFVIDFVRKDLSIQNALLNLSLFTS